MAGFASGEGCFHVSVLNSKSHKIGLRITLYFIITQNNRDLELLNSFIKFFNCGKIRSSSSPSCSQFIVLRAGDILKKIVPFFTSRLIIGTCKTFPE